MKKSAGEKFIEHFYLNQDFYALLKAKAERDRTSSDRHALKGYFEDAREKWISTKDPSSQYSLCNNYTPYYARKLIADGIVPRRFFVLRKSAADEIAYDAMFVTPGFNWFDVSFPKVEAK